MRPRGTLVLHVPHSSLRVPLDARGQFVLGAAALDQELLKMTDRYTDELFALPADEAVTVAFPVSRLVCDPERFEDPAMEIMEARGMGAVYRVRHGLKPLRRDFTKEEWESLRQDLLARYYRPHHERLARAVTEVLAAEGACLIVDAHSFPSAPLRYEDDQRLDRPSICLGTDPVHTPPELAAAAFDAFSARFDSVEFDRPFSGAMVPKDYFDERDERVCALMVEVRSGNTQRMPPRAAGPSGAGRAA